jgi:hypothetical protein
MLAVATQGDSNFPDNALNSRFAPKRLPALGEVESWAKASLPRITPKIFGKRRVRGLRSLVCICRTICVSGASFLCVQSESEPVFLNVYVALESIPRNEFRQPM